VIALLASYRAIISDHSLLGSHGFSITLAALLAAMILAATGIAGTMLLGRLVPRMCPQKAKEHQISSFINTGHQMRDQMVADVALPRPPIAAHGNLVPAAIKPRSSPSATLRPSRHDAVLSRLVRDMNQARNKIAFFYPAGWRGGPPFARVAQAATARPGPRRIFKSSVYRSN
jgi:hypothetical protein